MIAMRMQLAPWCRGLPEFPDGLRTNDLRAIGAQREIAGANGRRRLEPSQEVARPAVHVVVLHSGAHRLESRRTLDCRHRDGVDEGALDRLDVVRIHDEGAVEVLRRAGEL